MRTERIALRHVDGESPTAVAVREPTGRDEIAVDGIDTAAAVALLARVLVCANSAAPASSRLSACDRDRLLAALHRQCWGDRIVSTLTCSECANRFDLSFALSDVQRQLDAKRSATPSTTRSVESSDGHLYRVPSAEDELAAASHSGSDRVTALAAVCGATTEEIGPASDALERDAPIVDLDLAARCPECGCEQRAQFDLQSFALQRLLNERPMLLADVHRLADRYGWSLREILALPRSTRRALADVASDRWFGASPARTERPA